MATRGLNLFLILEGKVIVIETQVEIVDDFLDFKFKEIISV